VGSRLVLADCAQCLVLGLVALTLDVFLLLLYPLDAVVVLSHDGEVGAFFTPGVGSWWRADHGIVDFVDVIDLRNIGGPAHNIDILLYAELGIESLG